ncbi:sensor domain-containing protein [Pseudomarimonas salicorniae]|uniref:EAL domain-containing protein n=1 Tax=Pseudomarimonas salicorniae TaxID=2933270 RepID=A0ABT0GF08_9GAMM|nr:EAL domain-containing protein [Lysobacter sp. CAU 1642]MCK7593133.1 EAL domain-containing protein [Lysobacter sp. CAU 1642]
MTRPAPDLAGNTAPSPEMDAAAEVERLRDALVEARSSLATLIDAVPDAVSVLASDGSIREVNLAACEGFGRSREELVGMRIYELSPDIPPDRIQQVIFDHDDGEPFVHVTDNVRADGSRFPVEVHSRVFLLHGAPHVLAVARDITRRREEEAQRRESETRYRDLLRAMDKGVVVQDAEGRINSVNPAACRMLRRSEEELLRGDLAGGTWRFLSQQGEPLAQEELPAWRALREGRTIENTVVGVFDPEAQWRSWLSVTSTPIARDPGGEPFQVISTFDDITVLVRDSELFLRTQQLARIGSWALDPRSGEMFWSLPLYKMLGVHESEPVDQDRLLAHIAEAERETLGLALAEARRDGVAFDIECRTLSRRGSHRWARIIGEAQLRDGSVFEVSGTLQDITKDKLLEDTLRRQGLSDPLTGLANREALVERLGNALHQARMENGPAILHVDLDRFKVVNDLLGHENGNALVRAAGVRLAKLVDESVTVGRLEGDEFMLVLSTGGLPAAEALAGQINQAFHAPFLHEGEEFSITASIGIARFPGDGATVQQLMQNADAAMAEAKRRGRDTWQAFNPALAQQLSDRLVLETQLRRALEQDEFHLVYQPQVDLADGSLLQVEALLRWNNRLLGPMRPDLFIPVAETTGDIVRIGAWVIDEACRQLTAWRAQGLSLRRVAVNVSYRQFLNEDFEQHVLGALRRYGLDGDSLELEITERVLLEDDGDVVDTLQHLKSQGVAISIDDFGEGYSSLGYLKRLPIDALKIGHHFMREVPASATDAVICRSIIQIAHSLGLTVVGEGVEHDAQRRFLLEHGADLAQGYLFARPLPASELAAYRPPGETA